MIPTTPLSLLTDYSVPHHPTNPPIPFHRLPPYSIVASQPCHLFYLPISFRRLRRSSISPPSFLRVSDPLPITRSKPFSSISFVPPTGPGDTNTLRTVCKWWLHSSSGQVALALLLKVTQPHKARHIELWEWQTVPNPQVGAAHPGPTRAMAAETQEIMVTTAGANGAPLVLGFQKIFERPVGQGKGDLILTGQGLANLAARCWSALQ